MRRFLFNFHLYGALIVGLFVLVTGTTGSIMAFEEDLDRMFNSGLFRVAPHGAMLSAEAMLRAAVEAAPGQKAITLRLPQAPDQTAFFGANGRQMFLNPYTGQIVGSRDPSTPLGKIHQLHLRLLMGETGKTIVGCVAAALILLVLSGIYLWWPRKRVTIKWGSNLRRISFDAHNAVGICSALFLLVLGATGLVIHWDNDIEAYLHRSAGTVRAARNVPSGPAAQGARRITSDEAIAAAVGELPGTKPLYFSPPQNAAAAYLVALRYPEDLTPGGRSWANVDQYSGRVVGLQSSRTAPFGTRAIIVNRAIHTGDLFGYFSKTVMAVVCLMLIVQAITGYYMWWKKAGSAS